MKTIRRWGTRWLSAIAIVMMSWPAHAILITGEFSGRANVSVVNRLGTDFGVPIEGTLRFDTGLPGLQFFSSAEQIAFFGPSIEINITTQGKTIRFAPGPGDHPERPLLFAESNLFLGEQNLGPGLERAQFVRLNALNNNGPGESAVIDQRDILGNLFATLDFATLNPSPTLRFKPTGTFFSTTSLLRGEFTLDQLRYTVPGPVNVQEPAPAALIVIGALLFAASRRRTRLYIESPSRANVPQRA